MNNTSKDQGETLQALLASRSAGSWKQRGIWLACGVVILLGGYLLLVRSGSGNSVPRFRTQPVVINSLVVSVTATGRLQPTNQVEVGSELSGIVEAVFVDVNDQVRTGQVLARLDLAKLKDAIERSRANLASAEAQVLQAQATVAESRAQLGRLQEVYALSEGRVPSRTEMDAAEAALKRAEAGEAVARAGVVQARANLQSNQTDLDKASIRAAIDGVVLTRQVDPGQTVAASFQAPVLFMLAEDLTRMELQVDIDEADVGQVKAGQKATFTVDAWPGRRYSAEITRVGYGAREKDGVVSYPAVLTVANDDLSLRPGMTGTAEITTLVREDALLVPNAALRFTPLETVSPQAAPRSGPSLSLVPRLSRRPSAGRPAGRDSASQVWVLRDGQPVAVDVRTGASDGRMTEIVEGVLEPGMPVITEALGNPS